MDIEEIKQILNTYDNTIQQEASEGFKTFYDIENVLIFILDELDNIEHKISNKIIKLNDYNYFICNDERGVEEFNENYLVKFLYQNFIKGQNIILYDALYKTYYHINSVYKEKDDYIMNSFCVRLVYYDNQYNQMITFFSLRYNEKEDKTYKYTYNINLPILIERIKKEKNDETI